ncbi:Retinoic acid induced 16-like protein-domain-containing protein [Desarmillaria tabescens]|uniref:Retinoic acid induced 16-like protein-domain-containing protein n=1 Tax=Armillaria tabescens TaxID=1929756 RepID=A0AA39KEJ3_ARMTA|nr:Retinoic acid induced 16-like protein-domain-containing protein [Desarmillaria tabescens]KAK0459712.1 Retinoic acid induced 16-like protein-domain-containing protein [Desarmillaria tabescens]
MDYFSKFLRTGAQSTPKPPTDHALEFHKSWNLIKNTLLYPDERQLSRGIKSTDVPAHLQSLVDTLVLESTRTEEGTTGVCLEYLLKNDVLGTLVRLSETDRPSGIQAEVLRAVQNMVVLLDEQFLVHSAVHRAVLRLLRNCVGDDIQEQLDGRNKVMGAAGNAVRSQPSEYEEDLVNLLCILCSRIRTYRELLMIFFHDKHWYRSEPLFSVEEENEDEDEEDEDLRNSPPRSPSPSPSQATVTSAPASSLTKKPEYEFLLFNYLLRFVHREGQIGDFARAGLLFLMDVAMSPGEPVHRLTGDDSSSSKSVSSPADPITDAALALAEYILDGDFSEVLGAGLGAVYSLLPTKLEYPPPKSTLENAMVIGSTGLEDEDEREMMEVARAKSLAMGVEDATNPDFRSRLDHFLKLLEFLQDVLRRNVVHDSVDASSLVGTAIVHSILDAVRRIFLENVLYPSVLECSDTDGSAVAVMSYIEVMIRTLQDGQLADVLIDFLISEDNDEVRLKPRQNSVLNLNTSSAPPQASSTTAKQQKLRRRKSSAMVLLEMEAPDAQKQSEYFTSMGRFTLKDLLLTNLRSKSQPTATSALQLFQSLLLQRPQLCIDKIMIVIFDPKATSFPHPALIPSAVDSTPSVENDEDEETFVYPGSEEPSVPLETSRPLFYQPETTYSTHEREMGLYLTLVSRVDPSHNADPFSTGYDHYLGDALISIQNQPAFRAGLLPDPEAGQSRKHRLNVHDPILDLILDSLRKFFSNTPEFNIALTGVLATLATHPDRSLAGWLTFAVNDSLPTEGRDWSGTYDDGDDRSVDFQIEEQLEAETQGLPASSMDENSRPVVHTIFHGLVSQLEKYRQVVDDFDKFLLERRQGLLFSENLNDALSLAIEMSSEQGRPVQPVDPVTQPPPTKPKSKSSASSSASALVSFLTPKKSKAKASVVSSEPSTPPKTSENKNLLTSPFGAHYQKTRSITVEPLIAPAPSSGPWSPSKRSWNAEEEDVFSSGFVDKQEPNPFVEEDEAEVKESIPTVTLSRLLDNVVILEESMKELVAIIHARRSLGIDSVRYL